MNFKHILLTVGVLALVASVLAQNDYSDEEEPQKPVTRPSILRRPIIGQRGKPTTTTTTTPPPKEDVSDEEEQLDDEIPLEEDEQEAPTTTQASRKLKSGVVRPFRSNDDLLAALKRRRAEVANGKSHHQSEPTSAPQSEASTEGKTYSKNNNAVSGRRRFNLPAKSEPVSAPVEEAAKDVNRNRNRFSGRALYKANAADNTEIAGLESNQQSVEVKPRAYKTGQRRF